MPELRINPSLLAADIGHLADGCRRVEDAGADELHLDLMDGHFVPNMSFSPAVVEMARKVVDIPLNVHLMMTNPGPYVDAFCDVGADSLLIHIEPDIDHAAVLKHIRKKGVKPGIVLNPNSVLELIVPVLPLVDEVLFMTVFPGFGGQAFMPEPLARIKTLREQNPDLAISVDGGINLETASRCVEHGANVLDVGSSLFNVEDMKAEITKWRGMLKA